MKKISLFLLMFAAFISASLSAQDADIESVFNDYVVNVTDNNMSVVFGAGTLTEYAGGILMAFIDGVPVSNGSAIESNGAGGVAVIGTDAVCGCDLADNGEQISFAILKGDTLLWLDVIPPFTYAPNSFKMLSNEELVITENPSSGCTIEGADNYESGLQVYDGSCFWAGCQDSLYFEFDEIYTVNDPSACITLIVEGCMDPGYQEFDPLANKDDGSHCLTEHIYGCMNADACNYNESATTDVMLTGGQISCDILDGICDSCSGAQDGTGTIIDNDEDNDGLCNEADTLFGCTDANACNYDSSPTVNSKSSLCSIADEPCESCDGLVAVLFDDDGDGYCNLGTGLEPEEILGCIDSTQFNYDAEATESGICIPFIVGCSNPVAVNYCDSCNTADNSLCEYDGVNPFGPDGALEDAPNYFTSNNMSVMLPVDNPANWGGSNLDSGDVLFAVYTTSVLESTMYITASLPNGIESAGHVVYNNEQVGLALFGADNNEDNGYQEDEPLQWLVLSASDGLVYNTNVTYVNPLFDGLYEDGEFVAISSVNTTSLFYEGCMDGNYANFNPLATDSAECEELIVLGCLDLNALDYAGPLANPNHENSDNFGDPYLENFTFNVSSGAIVSVDLPATNHWPANCQTQIEGCTDPMAHNYDHLATQNDSTICDWSLNGLQEYNVDNNGVPQTIDFNFGSVDPQNQDNGILDSEFDNAQILFDEGYLNPDAHVIDNLADVMQWIDMDEERDADTVAAWSSRYDANELLWSNRYNDTLDSVAVWFAADELADSLQLKDSIQAWSSRYNANDLWWNNRYNDTLDSVAVWFAADEAADAQELADTIFDMQARYDAMLTYFLGTDKVNNAITPVLTDFSDGFHAEGVDEGLVGSLQDSLNYHRAPIVIDLHTQWNTVGYYLHHESSVQLQFIENFGTEIGVRNHINIVKNNEGLFYWPDFNFDGLGMLIPGQGYQVRVKDGSSGKSDFMFHHSISGTYRTLTPTVPEWAIDMPVDVHPNDVRTLVRVVNMLGQEVNPAEQFKGEVLLYMYNDGTVEKKMVK